LNLERKVWRFSSYLDSLHLEVTSSTVYGTCMNLISGEIGIKVEFCDMKRGKGVKRN
jgi:hypothetical protein